MTSEKDDLAKFLSEYQTSRCLFCKKFCNLAIVSNIAIFDHIIEHRDAAKNLAKSTLSDATKV